jgi:cytochrome c biogenesis protein
VALVVTALRGAWEEFTLLFSNIGFAVSLFAVWGLLTLIGVIVDQGKEPIFYTTNYAPALARVVLRLDLDNIYHSTAYISIIGLILVSMTVATFKRVIPARMPPLRAVKIDRIPLNASVTIEGSEESVRARVESFFAKNGWQVRKKEIDGVEWAFADKHNWARRGVLVAHVGFVIIAAGTTIYWALGFSGQTTILSGTEKKIERSGATIRLDRFYYRIDPIQTKSGTVFQPIDYISDLRVSGRDGTERSVRLQVNHPIDIDGTLYYQASYGFAISPVITKDGVPLANAPKDPVQEGGAFPIGATARTAQYVQFVGTLDAAGQPMADPHPNNPGVVFAVYDGDQSLGKVVIPIGKSVDLGGGYRLGWDRWQLYSGLQYRYDPGIPLVGLGAFVLLAGLCISFYMLPARLYVRLDGADRTWRIGLAATTVKGYEIFEEQFRALVTELERYEQRATVTPIGRLA